MGSTFRMICFACLSFFMGAFAVWWMFVVPLQQKLGEVYFTELFLRIEVASALQGGNGDSIVPVLEKSLPRIASVIMEDFANHSESAYWLSEIRDYYKKNNLRMAPALRNRLEIVPEGIEIGVSYESLKRKAMVSDGVAH